MNDIVNRILIVSISIFQRREKKQFSCYLFVKCEIICFVWKKFQIYVINPEFKFDYFSRLKWHSSLDLVMVKLLTN